MSLRIEGALSQSNPKLHSRFFRCNCGAIPRCLPLHVCICGDFQKVRGNTVYVCVCDTMILKKERKKERKKEERKKKERKKEKKKERHRERESEGESGREVGTGLLSMRRPLTINRIFSVFIPIYYYILRHSWTDAKT